MRVLVAAAELAPVTSVGGLGEAVAGLVAELRASGLAVVVVIPDYDPARAPLAGEVRRRLDVPAWAGPASVRVGAHATAGRLHLVTVPSIERSHPYLRPDGTGWPDNDARFFAFSRAVAALVDTGPPDVLHLHEWHTGAVLAALPASTAPPTVLTLHNVAYQGTTDGAWLRRLGPRARHFEWWGATNPLAGAIALADGVVAVSPHYADEIRRPADGGGLDGVLRQRGDALIGIRNGIDTERWDPATDGDLVARYDVDDRALPAARGRNRAAVRQRFGWPDDGTPLGVLVSRLTEQKGIDLLAPAVPVLRHVPLRLAVLGVGEAPIASALAALAADHPATLAFVERFDESLAHLLFGGADLFVMPSRFEPCGLAQLQAMRYGAIPVVTPVGGLVDTVPDVDATPDGHGIVADGVSSVGLVSALFRAGRLLADRRRHASVVRRIMGVDWSWREPARRYAAEYQRVLAARSRPVSGPAVDPTRH
jgi:starch synthase